MSRCAMATKCLLSCPWLHPPATPVPWPTFLPLAMPAVFVPWYIFLPLATHICCAYTMVHLPAGCPHLLCLCHGASSCPWPPPAMPAPLSCPWLCLPALALLSCLCLPTFMHLPHPCTHISAPHQLLYLEEPTIVGLLRYRSCEQHKGRQQGQQVYPHLSELWPMTHRLQVQVYMGTGISENAEAGKCTHSH